MFWRLVAASMATQQSGVGRCVRCVGMCVRLEQSGDRFASLATAHLMSIHTCCVSFSSSSSCSSVMSISSRRTCLFGCGVCTWRSKQKKLGVCGLIALPLGLRYLCGCLHPRYVQRALFCAMIEVRCV